MNTNCENCGGELQTDTASGLCPRCLMSLGFASRTMPTGERPDLKVSLSPEEMQELFPQYEILECLGRGGMGVVYKARQKALDRIVAIKVLAGERQGDADFARRFEREAKMLAQMSHPNIVTVHDFGEADGLYYLVMEYIDGVNLRALLADGKIDPKQALAIVPPICEALEYAHDKGVVHRDIKPENLLLDRDGRVMIADFGIASLVGAAGEKSGTPPYMAPEQAMGVVDLRADIYALGAVFYEMLTGERPDKDLIAPSKHVEIDVRLDEIVLRALEKEPARRYQTANEFRTMVETLRVPANPTGGQGREDGRNAVRSKAPETQRLSRMTIVGAAWAPFFFLAAFLKFVSTGSVMVQPGTPPPGPATWQLLLAFTVLPLGLTAPFGTTLLGWIAVTQIRRSAGRLYGLGLALFDGLVFPLLALDAFIGFLWTLFIDALADAGGPHFNSAIWLLLTIMTSVAVDLLIVRWTWRAVRRQPGGESASGNRSSAARSGVQPNRAFGRHGAKLLVLIVAILVVGIGGKRVIRYHKKTSAGGKAENSCSIPSLKSVLSVECVSEPEHQKFVYWR